MLTSRFVGAFVVSMTIALAGFDFYLNFDSVEGNTCSENILAWGRAHWPFPLILASIFGALLTHWLVKSDRG